MKFSLRKNTNINLTIYNVKGEFISTPIKGAFESGSYTISWNPEALKPGIYFCSMNAGEFSETKKIQF